MQQSDNLKGALFMVLAMASFVTGDMLVKFMAGDVNLGEIIAIRGVFAIVMTAFLMTMKEQWSSIHYLLEKKVLFRTLADTAATLFFFLGLSKIPLGNVSAIMQVVPLTVTLAAALFLGDKVGIRRWSAIIIGLIGVLMIIRPGFEGFDVFSLYIIATVFFVTIRDLLTRQLNPETPTLLVTLATTAMTTILGFCMVIPMGGPTSISGYDVVLLALGALTVIMAHQAVIIALRIGETSFTSPMRYASLPIAIIYGFVIFSEIPDIWMLVGSVIVVAMGIYTFHRERIVSRKR